MGMEFTDYLTWTVFRSVAPIEKLKELGVETRWNVQRDGWPPPPTPTDREQLREWVYNEYRDLCKPHGVGVHSEKNDNIVDFLTVRQAQRPDGKAVPLDTEGMLLLDSHLRRPLLPSILFQRDRTTVNDAAVRQFLGLFGSEAAERNRLNQTDALLDSEDAIIERAIRALHDWRATLEFLAILGIKDPSQEQRPIIVERDPSVIDSFNLHITRGRKPNLAHTMLCHLSNPLRFRKLLTTNFDTLLEDAFRLLHENFEPIPVSVRGELPSPNTVHSLNCIVKLHGALTETRADFSLDLPPTAEDLDRFFHYVCGYYPSDRRGTGVTNPSPTYIPSHLLVCGYSGSDHRCVQMLKHVLFHSRQTKIYWVCHTEADFSSVQRIFSEKEIRSQVIATVTDRVDLLFLELYQQLTLRLPRGGFSYQYSHDVPPKLWPKDTELAELELDVSAPLVDLFEDKKAKFIKQRTAEHKGELHKHEPQKSSKSTLWNHRLKEWKPCWIDVEATPEGENKVSSGLTVVLGDAIDQIRRKPGNHAIWIEMEDYSDTFGIAHQILQTISLRLGQYQLEHAVLIPGRMRQMLQEIEEKTKQEIANRKKNNPSPTPTSDEEEEEMENAKAVLWCYVLSDLLDYLKIEPERYAVFLYARNFPGMCAGWQHAMWDKGTYKEFHIFIRALSALGFFVAYTPLTAERFDHEADKSRQIKKLAKQLLADAKLDLRTKYGILAGNDLPPPILNLFTQFQDFLGEYNDHLNTTLIDEDVDQEDPNFSSRYSERYNRQFKEVVDYLSLPDAARGRDRIFCLIKVKPQHRHTRPLMDILRELVDSKIGKVHVIRQASPVTPKEQPALHQELFFMLASTHFRRSRPFTIFLKNPVFAPPKEFNVNGHDNDWSRDLLADSWLQHYRDKGLVWWKTGGNHWFFRDARLGLRHLLRHAWYIQPSKIEGTMKPQLVRHPGQFSAGIHYWAAQYYFQAFCSTSHAVPLCEALHHLVQCIRAVPFALRAHDTEDEFQADYKSYLLVRSLNDLIKFIRMGYSSMFFWLDRPAADAWFHPAKTSVVIQLINGVRDCVHKGSNGLKGLLSQAHTDALIVELANVLSICYLDFQREHPRPSFPKEGFDRPFDPEPKLEAQDLSSIILRNVHERKGDAFEHWEDELGRALKSGNSWPKPQLFRKTQWRNMPSTSPSGQFGHGTTHDKKIGWPQIAGFNINEWNSDLEEDDNQPTTRSGKKLYDKLIEHLHKALQSVTCDSDAATILSAIIDVSYDHIRRAKIVHHGSVRQEEKPGTLPFIILPSYPKARRHWIQVAILAECSMTWASLVPPSTMEFEMTKRIHALSHQGLALGRLGRFFEAHRVVTEADALLSKLPRRSDNVELAGLKLRVAEIHLMEASLLGALRGLVDRCKARFHLLLGKLEETDSIDKQIEEILQKAAPSDWSKDQRTAYIHGLQEILALFLAHSSRSSKSEPDWVRIEKIIKESCSQNPGSKEGHDSNGLAFSKGLREAFNNFKNRTTNKDFTREIVKVALRPLVLKQISEGVVDDDKEAAHEWLRLWYRLEPLDKAILFSRASELLSAPNSDEPDPGSSAISLAQQWIEIYGRGECSNASDLGRIECAKIDDAWAAIESAEQILAGRSRSSQLWGRLCALKLKTLGAHPAGPKFKTLPFRRRTDHEEELRKLLRLGYAVWPDDPFRRLRMADYFIMAWEKWQNYKDAHQLGIWKRPSKAIFQMLEQAFDTFAYDIWQTPEEQPHEEFELLHEYRKAVRKRLDAFRERCDARDHSPSNDHSL